MDILREKLQYTIASYIISYHIIGKQDYGLLTGAELMCVVSSIVPQKLGCDSLLVCGARRVN